MKFTGTFVVFALGVSCTQDRNEPAPGDGDDRLPPGRACESNEQCSSAWCIELPAGKACAFPCAGECGGGMICKRADGRDPSAPSICVTATSNLCNPCLVDTDCNAYGDLCVPRDNGSFCTLDCSETLACPEGYRCDSFRDGQGQELSRQCIPVSGSCTCTEENRGLRRPCTKSVPGVGTCVGEELCQPGVGWVSCDARTPVPEVCDQQDNDCDGITDEDLSGFVLQLPCGYGDEPRRQECIGSRLCVNGVFAACSLPQPPSTESFCDGLDDDCDGVVDDGLLHGVDNCVACGNPCPPGAGADESTQRTCAEQDGSYFCGPIKCRVPFFDVNGSESDGCEVEDDHSNNGGVVVLNDEWTRALPIGSGSLGCEDGCFENPNDASWRCIYGCEKRIPTDRVFRQHVPTQPKSPNVDYFRFYMEDSSWLCEPELWFCANFAGLVPADDGASVRICFSNPQNTIDALPVFPDNRCETIVLDTPELYLRELGDVDNKYVYVKVSSAGLPYAGYYSVAAFDSDLGNQQKALDTCPLGQIWDRCDYPLE